jgi:hypothetical protein
VLSGVIRALSAAVLGESMALPVSLLERHPVLALARWRRGGLPPRIGGWALGRASVLGIAVGRTIFLAPATELDIALLLHEVAHVQQFEQVSAFPARYLWESLRRGYHNNRFEREADAWAAAVLSLHPLHPAPSVSIPSRRDRIAGIQDLQS